MSKIKIPFDNSNYNIDESAMIEATDKLKSHLSTVMNGSGYVVSFGGTSYNVDSTKLANETNDFISHIGTIAGNGKKVAVNGVWYNVDSTKLSDSVDELHTVLGGLHSDDESGEDLGSLNEYGFYYDKKYNTCERTIEGTLVETIYCFREDGTVEGWHGNLGDDYSNYNYAQLTATYSKGTIEIPDWGLTFNVIFDDGTVLHDGGFAYRLGDGVIVDDDYIYAFQFYVGSYGDIQKLGWRVYAKDKTKSSYAAIRSDMPDAYPLYLEYTFYECYNLIESPEIPSNVVSMQSTFGYCENLKTVPVIPHGVENMNFTFGVCTGLETAPVIPSSVTTMRGTFSSCTNLTGNIEINADPSDCSNCFKYTEKPITITGSCSEYTKKRLAASANNGNVTY